MPIRFNGGRVADTRNDIQLKFDGEPVKRLGGAPADAVIASLNALQRMTYIIGMRFEGRNLSERLKPTAKVKREYSLICRAPERGSHIQPFDVTSAAGTSTPEAVAARDKLLRTLKAFDSGDDEQVERVLPNARERWFMAKAALGLLPAEESGLEIAIRAGSRGPYSFKAGRARALLARYDSSAPPEIDEEVVAGKLRAIDYAQTIITIKPSSSPAIRMDYPLQLEKWLQSNVRRRLKITGVPHVNQKGDISSFKEIFFVTELEPTIEPIKEFTSGPNVIETNRALSIPITVDWKHRLFFFQDPALGIDAYALSHDELRDSVLDELEVLWRQYALASDDDLDSDSQLLKQTLKSRFRKAKSDQR